MTWQQVHDPVVNMALSTVLGTVPVGVMLVASGCLYLTLQACVWPFTLMVVREARRHPERPCD